MGIWGVASEVGQASKKRGVSKVASSNVVTSEWSRHSQILYQNETKDVRWFDLKGFGSRLLSIVIKYTEIIVIERQILFLLTFNRRIMDV